MSGRDRLRPIVADVQRRLAERRQLIPERQLLDRIPAEAVTAPRRSLSAALRGGRQRPAPYLIAEIKRRSPAAGALGEEIDAAAVAARYAAGGAAAISVVTEPDHFGGDPADLGAVRPLGLPVLRKDFIVDEYQVLESFVLGADAVLLIARILTPAALHSLLTSAGTIGLEALVEVNDEADVERALAAGADLIGINNRDLATFAIDPDRTARLIRLLPSSAIVVSASGMSSGADVRRAHRLGADACLIGEALMKAADPVAWLAAVGGESG